MALELKKEYLEEQEKREKFATLSRSDPNKFASVDKTGVFIGSLWLAGGIIASMVSYITVPESGGTYFVFWGAVIYGGYRILRSF